MEGFPKLKYHVRGGGHVVVTSPEQEKALGPDWVDHRAVGVAAPAKPPIPAPETPKKRGRQAKAAG